MSDLLRRIKRPRRTPAADPAPGFARSDDAEAPLEASPGAGGPLLAGEDADDQRPTALRRGRLRKRLRFLDRERELLLRDLGGLVYEIHRTGTAADRERHRALVAGKVGRLAGLDAELESGLAALGEARGDTVLREPGIGGLCPRCGEIHGSDARFCSACGFPLEVAGTPGAAAGQGPAAGIGDAIVPAVGVPAAGPAAAAAVTAGVGTHGSVPDAAQAGTPAGAETPSTPVASDGPGTTAPFEDQPTRIVTRPERSPGGTGASGERPPSEPEPR